MEAQQRKAYAKYRTAGAAKYRRSTPQLNVDLREMIVMQCIVSGIILVFALAINFAPVNFAKELRADIKQALSEETTTQNLIEMGRNITDKYHNMQASIKAIFGGVTDDTVPAAAIKNEVSATPPVTPLPTALPTPVSLQTQEFRIDEDILETLNSQQDYYEVNAKKSLAPTSSPVMEPE